MLRELINVKVYKDRINNFAHQMIFETLLTNKISGQIAPQQATKYQRIYFQGNLGRGIDPTICSMFSQNRRMPEKSKSSSNLFIAKFQLRFACRQ